MTYFGARHSCDIDNDQWKVLEQEWRKFASLTNQNKRVVFFEGAYHSAGMEELEKFEVVKVFGEIGALQFFAKDDQVEKEWIDSNMQDEARYLLSKFDSSFVVYYFFARMVTSAVRRD